MKQPQVLAFPNVAPFATVDPGPPVSKPVEINIYKH